MYGSIDEEKCQPEASTSVSGDVVNKIVVEKRSAVVLRVTFVTAALVVLSFVASIYTHHSNSPILTSSIKLIERTTYSSLSDTEKESLFEAFISTYSRIYDTDEEYQYRLGIFKSNLDVADERNAEETTASGDAVHGVTKFSDLTSEEFSSKYLIGAYDGQYAYTGRRLSSVDKLEAKKMFSEALKSARAIKKSRGLQAKNNANGVDLVIPDVDGPSDGPDVDIDGPVDTTPSMADWTGVYTTPVNDQGDGCSGASWAFAAVEQIESDAIRKGVMTTSDALSVQQALACNYNSSGCAGGSVESTYSYSKRPGALMWASDYPYTSTGESAGECTDSGTGYALTLGSYATVTKYHNEAPTAEYTTTQVEANMMAHLVATGTLHACLDASTWSTYVSGAKKIDFLAHIDA